jgi:O-antigen/teichoic acid export membrane protein
MKIDRNLIIQKISLLKKSKPFTAGMAYTIGNLLLRGIAFLSIPIFTRLLSPSDFGLYSVFVSYESILFLFVGLCLHSSIRAANIEFKSSIDDYVSSIFLMVLCNAVLFFLGSLIFGKAINNISGFATPILFLMVTQAISSAILAIYNNKISLSYNYKMYLFLTSFSAVGNVLFSIVLILSVFKETPYMGRIIGTVIPVFLAACFLVIKQFKKNKPAFNKEYWKFGFFYSLPIIPHGFSQVLLAQFSRIMIQNMVGNVETGLFSFAFTIAMIPRIIATSLDTAWGPWFFERYRNKEITTIRHRANQYVMIFSSIIVSIAAISPEIIHIMAPNIYWNSVYIVIPAILGSYFTFLYYLPASIEYYEKKTGYIAIGTVLSGIINILLTYYAIKEFSYIHAAYATVLAYAANLGFHLIIARRISGALPYNMKKIFLYMTMTLLASLILSLNLNNLIFRATTLIAFLIIILSCELLSSKNRS